MSPLGPGHQRLAVWSFINSSSTYVDNSRAARSVGGTTFSIFSAAADRLYIGLEDRFDMVIFFLSIAGSIGDRTWEYYDGDSWDIFSPGLEYAFTATGVEQFDRLNNWRQLLITSTNPHAATPPDNIPRYWMRVQVASVTTAPTVNQIVLRSYAAYATATDVAETLQLGYDFSSDTIPTRHTVEDYIHNAQSRIDYLTRKSWRPNYAQNEEHDFNRAGFQLVRNYPTNILSLGIWDGANYDMKTEGRDSDFFLVENTGMIHFARFFLLPARIQAYGAAMWGWGFGEFTYPVRVSYIYGSNIYEDEREGSLVNMITKKMAAIDVIQMHDYSLIANSGVDRISLERKSDMWRSETDERLEELKSWEVF